MADRIVSMLLPPKIAMPETRRIGQALRERAKITPPEMARIRKRSSQYRVAAVDIHGRILARHLIGALSWEPGQLLALTGRAGLIVVTPGELDSIRLTAGGYLRLPATLRHWHGLKAGERVLLVADPDKGRLVIHPPASVDAMITLAYVEVFPGDVS